MCSIVSARSIHGDSYLILGAAETVVGVTERLKVLPDKRGLYAPNLRPARPQSAAGRAAPRLVAWRRLVA